MFLKKFFFFWEKLNLYLTVGKKKVDFISWIRLSVTAAQFVGHSLKYFLFKKKLKKRSFHPHCCASYFLFILYITFLLYYNYKYFLFCSINIFSWSICFYFTFTDWYIHIFNTNVTKGFYLVIQQFTLFTFCLFCFFKWNISVL